MAFAATRPTAAAAAVAMRGPARPSTAAATAAIVRGVLSGVHLFRGQSLPQGILCVSVFLLRTTAATSTVTSA